MCIRVTITKLLTAIPSSQLRKEDWTLGRISLIARVTQNSFLAKPPNDHKPEYVEK
jgi:hypothetical protein